MSITTNPDEDFDIKCEELESLMQTHNQDGLTELQEKFNDIHDLEKRLKTNFLSGLSDDDDDISRRKKIFGQNEIPKKASKSFLRLMFEAMQDVTLIILIICAVLSFVLNFYPSKNESSSNEINIEWIESLAIIVAVFVVIVVTAFNDWSKEKQFRGLQNRIEAEQKFNLIRNSRNVEIQLKDIVVGDICQVKYGDVLPADGLVIQSNDLKIDESSLTGESDLISKNVSKNPFLLSGTHVMEGSGKMLVLAVGEHSQIGIISNLLRTSSSSDKNKDDDNKKQATDLTSKERSILQTKLTQLAIRIGYVGMLVALLTVSVLIFRFSWEEFYVRRQPWRAKYFNRFVRFFITGITVLVVAVPEGLPLAVTVSLAYAVKKMMKDNNLVRHLDACETMGNATTICSDKTGTLTTNRMTVVEVYFADHHWKNVNCRDQLKDLFISEKTKEILAEGISVNSSYTSRIASSSDKDPLMKQLGNKTECGLLSFVNQLGKNYEEIRKTYPEENFLHLYTFNSVRKSMATVIRRPDSVRLHIKGASEIVLKKCTKILDPFGETRPLTDDDANYILRNVIEPMADDGLRTICIAYKDFDSVPVDWDDEWEIFGDLTCICICGIEDPVRPGVREAIEQCQEAGITVRMITGDNVSTARSIALKCGIIKPCDRFLVLDGKEFNRRIRPNRSSEVSQDLFDQVAPNLRVLARSSPQDKYLLVKHLVESSNGSTPEIVAVTGDGTNDGPALKKADVGFSMGIQGTDVAKEASDIILVDDNFTSIVKAVMWGRNVIDSLSKFLQFQLTVNLVALICAFVGACVVKESPLRAVQMLWVNLIMDTLASLALATDKPNRELLKRKPLGRSYPLISARMWKNILGHSVYQLTIILVLLFQGSRLFDFQNGLSTLNGFVPSEHFTMIFNTFVLMTLFNEINCRRIHGEINVFRGIFSNKLFCAIWISTFVVQIILVQFASVIFSCVPLTIDLWAWCFLFGIGSLLWHQVVNLIPTPRCKCPRKSIQRMTNGFSNVSYDTAYDFHEAKASTVADYQTRSSDNDLRFVRILWLRNIRRIQMQLRVIDAFRRQVRFKTREI